jgi:hypothetical protein
MAFVKLLPILLFALVATAVKAQRIEVCDSPSAKGNVQVYADSRLNNAIAATQPMEGTAPTLQGYRIQIYSGNDRNQASHIKETFLKMYPNQPAYLDYSAPNFRIKIGDFRSKLEAQKLFHDLKQSFGGGVLLVPDKINFPELK